MIGASLLLAGVQISGLDIPDSFLGKERGAYYLCLATEEKGSPDSNQPEIHQFAQLMQICREERVHWGNVVRAAIQTRHPDWTKEKVETSVEFAISAFEIQLLLRGHESAVTYTSHERIGPEF